MLSSPLTIEGYEIPGEWVSTFEEVKKGKTTLVLGASNSGKTTLVKFLINEFVKAGGRIAFVDGDIGQSTLGVPTTVGSSIISSAEELMSPRIKSLFFVGSTSPPGHLLQLASGLRQTVDILLRENPDAVIIDTTGFIGGGAAFELKYQKISLLRPTHIVAIQKEGELEPILRSVHGSSEILRLKPAVGVTPRLLDERQAYREKKFREYFSSAKTLEFDFDKITLRRHGFGEGLPIPEYKLSEISRTSGFDLIYGEEGRDEGFFISRSMGYYPPGVSRIGNHIKKNYIKVINRSELHGGLVGLGSCGDFISGLGIIKELKEGKIEVLTPIKDPSRISLVTIGTLKLDPQGREVGKI